MIHSLLPPTAAAALVAAAAAPAATPHRAADALVSLSATPAHLILVGSKPQTVVVHNDGAAPLRVVVQPAGFSFDLYGNAAIGAASSPPRSAASWLTVRPMRLVIAPGAARTLRIAAKVPLHAGAGDHHALVLLSALLPRAGHVSIRTRLGVLVLVRVPGRIVRRLTIRRVWVVRSGGRRSIVVAATNGGNVAERLQPGEVTVSLRRAGRLVATLRALPRDLLPHTRGLIVAPLNRPLRGPFTAVVRIAAQPGASAGPLAPELPAARRLLRLRL